MKFDVQIGQSELSISTRTISDQSLNFLIDFPTLIKGKDGKDFKYEDFTAEQLDVLKLKFSDLTPEQIQSLKLTFSDLTLEERLSLKGDKGDSIKGDTGLSAYAYAVKGGYQGTEQQFGQEQATIANNSTRLTNVENTKQDKPIAGRSFLTPLFVARGAVFNDKTGYYELNGLTDITESQMMTIYNESNNVISSNNSCYLLFKNSNMRTNYLPLNNSFTGSNAGYFSPVLCDSMFRDNQNIETIIVSKDSYYFNVRKMNYIFYNCPKLRIILGIIDISGITDVVYNSFYFSIKLESIQFRGLKTNISFQHQPLLTLETIQYLIANAINTIQIIVTLHETAKAKLTEDLIALASSKNITIA